MAEEFLRATIVGLIATGADFAALIGLVEGLRVHYLIANGCSYAFGTAVNYLLSVRWAFGARSLRSPTAEFCVFAAAGVVGLGISQAGMYAFTGWFRWHYAQAKVLSVACHFVWNFASRKVLLFRGADGRRTASLGAGGGAPLSRQPAQE